LKILIIGLGSMGRRYVDILNHYDHDLYALRSGISYEDAPEGVESIMHYSDIGVTPDIAFITNPSHLHIKTAIECAKRGINLFIEKPIDVSSRDLGKLIEIVKEKKLAAYVAYPFRFHSGLYELRRTAVIRDAEIVCKTDYRKWQPYKVGTHKRKHDGVLLELSHEIDIAQWFFGRVEGIKGYFGDTTADLMLDCLFADHDIRVRLDLESDVEERYMMLDGQVFPYQATDGMYELQVNYYLDNFVKPLTLINTLESAADMFYRLIQFRDAGREDAEHVSHDMRP